MMQLPAEELGKKINLCFEVQSLGSVSLTGGSMRNAVWRTVTVNKYQECVNEVTVLNILVKIDNSSAALLKVKRSISKILKVLVSYCRVQIDTCSFMAQEKYTQN